MDEFDNFLREAYGEEIEICGHVFDTVEIFKKLDPEAYQRFLEAYLEQPALKLIPA